jgi:hypothetical protein
VASSVPGLRRAILELSPAELLSREQAADRDQLFVGLDELVGRLLTRRLAGERIGTAGWTELAISGLSQGDLAFIHERFARERIQAHGAWFLPDQVPIAMSVLLPRASRLDRSRPATNKSPEAIFAWAALQPVYDTMVAPFVALEMPAVVPRAERLAAWREIETSYASLGLDPAVIGVMRFGGGWSRLSRPEKNDAGRELLATLAANAATATRRFRALRIQNLARAYYQKADKDGRALRRRVVVGEPLQQSLVGYFSGDWLAFLDYIGEEPHRREEVFTALPPPTVRIGGRVPAEQAAVALRIPPAEAAKIAATYWGTSGDSPVELRLRALEEYWQALDATQAVQQAGMASLDGLLPGDYDLVTFPRTDEDRPPVTRGIYRTLIPHEVREALELLWGTMLLPRWPDRMVSTPVPDLLAAQTVGVAVTFWHRLATRVWDACEGYGREAIDALPEALGSEIVALESAGFAVDSSIFTELMAASRASLHPRPSLPSERHEFAGLVITVTTGAPKLEGFERLRDIVTRHRRTWSAAHLRPYLRWRAESDVREASVAYHRLASDASRPPTLRTFAVKTQGAVNRWFGGDMGGLYAAIGEQCPKVIRRPRRVLPADPFAFARDVALELPAFGRANGSAQSSHARNARAEALATVAVRYCQTWEALDHRPTLRELGQDLLANAQTAWLHNNVPQPALDADPDRAFELLVQSIDRAMARQEPAVRNEGARPTSSPLALISAPREAGARAPVSELLGRLRSVLGPRGKA